MPTTRLAMHVIENVLRVRPAHGRSQGETAHAFGLSAGAVIQLLQQWTTPSVVSPSRTCRC